LVYQRKRRLNLTTLPSPTLDIINSLATGENWEVKVLYSIVVLLVAFALAALAFYSFNVIFVNPNISDWRMTCLRLDRQASSEQAWAYVWCLILGHWLVFSLVFLGPLTLVLLKVLRKIAKADL
jgi:hypothetical protein